MNVRCAHDIMRTFIIAEFCVGHHSVYVCMIQLTRSDKILLPLMCALVQERLRDARFVPKLNNSLANSHGKKQQHNFYPFHFNRFFPLNLKWCLSCAEQSQDDYMTPMDVISIFDIILYRKL